MRNEWKASAKCQQFFFFVEFFLVYSILEPLFNLYHHTIVPTPFQYLIVSNNRNRTINFVFFYVIRFSFISIACSTNTYNGVFFDWHFFFPFRYVRAGSLGQCCYYKISLLDKQILMKMKKKPNKARADENTGTKKKNCRSQVICWKQCDTEVWIDAQIIK